MKHYFSGVELENGQEGLLVHFGSDCVTSFHACQAGLQAAIMTSGSMAHDPGGCNRKIWLYVGDQGCCVILLRYIDNKVYGLRKDGPGLHEL